MGRTKLKKGEETVILSARVPESVKSWLEVDGGGGRGAVSKAVRRLVKEEQWRRAGKYTDVEESDRG